MIVALISLMVISRFGSVGNLTTSAEQKVESLVSQGQKKITGAGAMARSGFQRVSYGVNAFLFSGAATSPAAQTEGSAPNPSSEPKSARPTPQPPPRSEQAPDSTDQPNRDKRSNRPNRSER
jgi:hypothetical protein